MRGRKKEKIYVLDNGSSITAKQLASEVGITIPSARYRLNKYTDEEIVLAPIHSGRPHRNYKCKSYLLSDGARLTAREIASKYQVPLETVRNRLSSGIIEVSKLSKKPSDYKIRIAKENLQKRRDLAKLGLDEILSTKPFYDQSEAGVMWRLAMKCI